MCGRYASSRQPEDLVEEFEITLVPDHVPRIEADWNVAPTKEVYAVVERPPRDEDGTKAEQPERQLRVLTWGLVPFWSKDTSGASRMINARMETVADKPAYRRAFERRRCLLPADGYYEWYATGQLTAKGKPRKQPFFIRPRDGGTLAMAGLYEIWRDPTKADDDPDRFRWTTTVLTTSAEDSLGHIHDRMPLMLEPDAYDAWLDPTSHDRGRLLDLLVPAAPGRLEAFPVATLVSNVQNNGPSWSRRCRCPRSRPRWPAQVRVRPVPEPEERLLPTPQGPRPGDHPARRPARLALMLQHGANGGIGARDLVALATRLPGHGITTIVLQQPFAVAGKRVAPRPAVLDECLAAVVKQLRLRTPLVLGGRSSGARCSCRMARELGAVAALALAFPLHPPGRPEKSRADELLGSGGADARGPGHTRHVRRTRGVPAPAVRHPAGRRTRRGPRVRRDQGLCAHPGRDGGRGRRRGAGLAGRGGRESPLRARVPTIMLATLLPPTEMADLTPLEGRSVGWGAMTESTDPQAGPATGTAQEQPRRPRRAPRERDRRPSAPPASSATRCRSSTSSTRPRCG
jgi:putative SOS response-associated peptidase YedK